MYGDEKFCPYLNKYGVKSNLISTSAVTTNAIASGAVRLGTGATGAIAGKLGGVFVRVTGAKDTRITVAHNLGRTPIGYIQVRADKGGVVYDASAAVVHTASKMFLKLSATGVYKIIAF